MPLSRRWLSGALLCVCCSSNLPVARAPLEHIDVPAEVESYSTEATAGGVVGGARGDELGAEVASALQKRGDAAVPDGTLGATASWVLRELNQGRSPGAAAMDAAARRFGFAGVIASYAGFSLDQGRGEWRAALARIPPNMPITRYGVSVSNSGRSAAVTFGATEITLLPFARHLELGEKLELRGEVSARYAFAHVYLTKTDGTVEERRMPSRKIDTTFSFTTPGIYQLEVMGDGVTGPVIVCNVPIYVAVEEEKVTASTGHATSPAEAEARMFVLLNQSRKAANLAVLQPDSELREIALSHSTDMAENDFFGHVSPTTGTPEDRLRRSGALLAAFGENVAEADSAETAHDGLMASPGHRANMLGASYTHVGIAVVETDSHQLAFTLIFGRRPDPATLPRTADQVEAAFLALRRRSGLSLPVSDPIYRAAAAAGVTAYVDASTPTTSAALHAAEAALSREVQRTHSARPSSCSLVIELLELAQLDKQPALLQPTLPRFGLAARMRTDKHGSRLVLMMLLEERTCG